MKRKRALEVGETPQDAIKVKKLRSRVKNNENDNFMLDKNIQGSTVSNLQPVLRNTKKRSTKTALNKDLESSNIMESVKPGMSSAVGNINKKKRKSKGDINQNGDVSEDVQTEDSKTSPRLLKKRKQNGLQGRAASDSPSDFQPLGNFLKIEEPLQGIKKKNPNVEQPDSVINDIPSGFSPIKKKRGRKPGQEKSPKEVLDQKSSATRQGVLKSANKKKRLQEFDQNDSLANVEPIATKTGKNKTKKKVRIDETESLKIKKELAEAEPHFSVKQLPAKIIKSKLNKSLTEEVKVSPLTIQTKKERKNLKKSKLLNKNEGHVIKSEELHIKSEDEKFIIKTQERKLEDDVEQEHVETGIKHEPSITSEESDLEVYYINKNAEREARKKSQHSILMPKEDQLILVQRMQEVIPDGDTKSYKYRLQNLEWQKIAFKNYSLEECQKVWVQLLKKVRHYRLLIEITHDIKQVIELNDLLETQPRKSKSASKKHPDMPKRPLTSYFLYFIRKRDKIGKERPDLDTIELNKFISEKYQTLTVEKKQKYELLAAKNREEYKRQLEEFYAKHPEMRKVVIKKKPKRKERKEKVPKRPENPYKLFMLSELSREEIAEEDKAEFKEVCREKWRQMLDSKKLGWINLAEEHLTKYEEELKEYMARHPEYTPKSKPHKPFLSREEVNLKDKLAGKPKKPPGTAYGLFISMTLQSTEIVDIPPRERWNYTSTKWKAMTEEEREQYKQLLTQVQNQYQKDFAVYLDSLPEDKRQAEILNNLPKKRKNAAVDKPSTSGTKPKPSAPKNQSPRVKTTKQKVQNPTPPSRSAYKYFAEKYEGENPKEAWKNLASSEKEKFEDELSIIKDKYIKDFEIYLKSLTKDELAAFCANRSSQEEYSSSDESDSQSERGDVESSDESSNSSESENDSDEH